MRECNFSLLVFRKINFKAVFQFDDCDCLVREHQAFAVFCKKCWYNVCGFARNYFAR